jgi:hypothetical protein
MPHGGPGRNQGRKPINGRCPRIKTSITIDPENLKWLDSQLKSRSDVLDALMRQARDFEEDSHDC